MNTGIRILIVLSAAVFTLSNSIEAQAQSANARGLLELAAVIKSYESAVLSSQLDGTVSKVNVREGDAFAKGDILLALDCTLQQAALDKAKAQVEFTRNEYKSTRSLEKLNSTTKVQVARSAAEFAKAKADVATASYHVDKCLVVAPFDGTVVQSWVNSHETIQAKEDLLEIVNNSDLVAEFLAPSAVLASLTNGKAFRLRVSETGQDYVASIHKIIPMVDSVSQTVKVIGRFESDHTGLWSGMSGLAVMP